MAKRPSTDTDTTPKTDDVATLRAELAREKSRAATAEAERDGYRSKAREAELASMSAEERALVSQQEANETAISSLESEIEGYENQIAQLSDEPGHGKDIAQLTRKMAQASARLEAETGRKDQLAGAREQMTTRGKQRQDRETAEASAEKIADGTPITAFTPTTQAWIRRHDRLFSDSLMVKKARIAAQEATEVEGLRDQSPEYFDFIETKIGLKAAPATEEEDEQQGDDLLDNPPEEREAAPAQERYEPEKPQGRAAGSGSMAPVVNQRPLTPTGGGGNRRAPALTASEREVADSLYASIRNPADRYLKYAENRKYMATRDASYFRN